MGNFKFLNLAEIQNWEDECFRITTGSLDYEKILNREINRVRQVQDAFLAMDEETY